MVDLELTRTRGDRRAYELSGIGMLRLAGWLSSGATAEADGRSWSFVRRGFLRATTEAVDSAGGVAGTFVANGLRRGGRLAWGDREYALRSASILRERYALTAGADRDAPELATIEGKSWGRRPVRLTVADPDALEHGLLLFVAFVVRRLAQDASSAAGGGAAVAGTAATS
jgi:hypothetical protein